MKRIILLLLIISLASQMATADLIEVNQGGDQELIISPIGNGELGFWTGIPAEEEKPPTGGVSGGGGGLGEDEKQLPNPELQALLEKCENMTGEIVGIKGGIFCYINDTYIPIEDLKEQIIKIGEYTIPNFGAMVMKESPFTGWIIIGASLVLIIIFIRDQLGSHRERKKAEHEDYDYEYDYDDRNRRRPDGGHY